MDTEGPGLDSSYGMESPLWGSQEIDSALLLENEQGNTQDNGVVDDEVELDNVDDDDTTTSSANSKAIRRSLRPRNKPRTLYPFISAVAQEDGEDADDYKDESDVDDDDEEPLEEEAAVAITQQSAAASTSSKKVLIPKKAPKNSSKKFADDGLCISKNGKRTYGRACARCRRDHKACDGGRPCSRCAEQGSVDECVDVPIKPLGRPKKIRPDGSTAATTTPKSNKPDSKKRKKAPGKKKAGKSGNKKKRSPKKRAKTIKQEVKVEDEEEEEHEEEVEEEEEEEQVVTQQYQHQQTQTQPQLQTQLGGLYAPIKQESIDQNLNSFQMDNFDEANFEEKEVDDLCPYEFVAKDRATNPQPMTGGLYHRTRKLLPSTNAFTQMQQQQQEPPVMQQQIHHQQQHHQQQQQFFQPIKQEAMHQRNFTTQPYLSHIVAHRQQQAAAHQQVQPHYSMQSLQHQQQQFSQQQQQRVQSYFPQQQQRYPQQQQQFVPQQQQTQETDISRREAHTASLVKAATRPILVLRPMSALDKYLTVLGVSDAMCTMLGYSREELVVSPQSNSQSIVPIIPPGFMHRFDKAAEHIILKSNVSYSPVLRLDLVIRTKSGNFMLTQSKVQVYYGDGGRGSHMAVCIEHIMSVTPSQMVPSVFNMAHCEALERQFYARLVALTHTRVAALISTSPPASISQQQQQQVSNAQQTYTAPYSYTPSLAAPMAHQQQQTLTPVATPLSYMGSYTPLPSPAFALPNTTPTFAPSSSSLETSGELSSSSVPSDDAPPSDSPYSSPTISPPAPFGTLPVTTAMPAISYFASGSSASTPLSLSCGVMSSLSDCGVDLSLSSVSAMSAALATPAFSDVLDLDYGSMRQSPLAFSSESASTSTSSSRPLSISGSFGSGLYPPSSSTSSSSSSSSSAHNDTSYYNTFFNIDDCHAY